jgi:hypothetical protein
MRQTKPEMSEREKWFLNHVGEKVYRNKTTCSCSVCKDSYENGLIISDDKHAGYLFDIECEYTREGSNLRYKERSFTKR